MRCAEMVCFLLVCTCLVCVDAAPKLAVPDWFNHKTLGVGVHASPQLKHAAAKALKNFRSLIREKVIVKGEEWKTKFRTGSVCAFIVSPRY